MRFVVERRQGRKLEAQKDIEFVQQGAAQDGFSAALQSSR